MTKRHDGVLNQLRSGVSESGRLRILPSTTTPAVHADQRLSKACRQLSGNLAARPTNCFLKPWAVMYLRSVNTLDNYRAPGCAITTVRRVQCAGRKQTSTSCCRFHYDANASHSKHEAEPAIIFFLCLAIG